MRKGKERACKNIFHDPLLPTVGLMRCRKSKKFNLSINWKCSPLLSTTPVVRDICTFAVLISVSQIFFASLVFMKGT